MLSIGLYCISKWPHIDEYLFNSSYTFHQYPFFVSLTLILINLAAFVQIRSANKSILICISVLRLVYFSLLGDKVNNVFVVLHECSNHDYYCSPDYKHALKLILCGGVASIFFWGCSSAVWPFHRRHLPSQNRAWWKRSRML